MIKVSFMYTKTESNTFDMDYYINVHCPLATEKFGSALKGLSVDKGISGVIPGSPAPFHAIGTLLFDSVESFYGALIPVLDDLRNDAKKYSEGDPVIQISEIAVA